MLTTKQMNKAKRILQGESSELRLKLENAVLTASLEKWAELTEADQVKVVKLAHKLKRENELILKKL